MVIDRRNHSDETDCEGWPCNNIYTRCDGFRNCLDGKDEENCTQPIRLRHFLYCMTSQNYKLICLPADQIIGGVVDCFKTTSDELIHSYRTDNIAFQKYRFRCWNDTQCVEGEDLCNGDQTCSMGGNELFCDNHLQFCKDSDFNSSIDSLYISCHIINTRVIPFSLETAQIYPSSHSIQINSDENSLNDNETKPLPENFVQPQICNYGLYISYRLGIDNYSSICFCPPNYYGDRCQYQNQRVSLTLSLGTVDWHIIYAIVVTLIEDDNDQQEIHTYHQFTYVPKQHCGKTLNIYLLYSNRKKNNLKNYTIRIDAFDKSSLTYLLSWRLTIPFVFLPVNRLTALLTLPIGRIFNYNRCPLQCHNGICMKYQNEERFFCKCHSGWSGVKCHIPIDCSMCALDSICIGLIRNRSICVCPYGKFGSFCRLKLECPKDFCENNGRCVVMNERMINASYTCFCSEPFYGRRCEENKKRVEISFRNIEIPSYLLVYIFTETGFVQINSIFFILKKVNMFQNSVIMYSQHEFQMIFVKIDIHYYLTVLQKSPWPNISISTSINPSQRCVPFYKFFSSELLALPRIHRLKSYHIPCQHDLNLQCFIDELYICLCTEEHHSNCFPLDHKVNFTCQDNVYCENGGTCLQDQPICFLSILCICPDCFFGNRCQFYAKGIGLTLDDLLRYVIQPNITLNDQSLIVKLSVAFTTIVFVIGLLNSFLGYLVFRNQSSRRVGSGIYLRLSSIISTLVVSMLMIKFWFILYTYMNLSINRSVLRSGCLLLEPILRLFLHMSNWLNACVAIERAISVFKGINFNMKRSRCIARWIICFLPFLILSSMSHEFIYRDLFDDHEEQRVWCVLRYSWTIEKYSTFIHFFHFVTPFSANIFSALFIIINIARQRTKIQTRHSYEQQLLNQFNEHKQLIISPIVLVILSFPRLLISLFTGCVKASRNPWLYLIGYFISFIPSSFVFIIFVLPSTLYKKQFKESISTLQQEFTRIIRV